MRAFYEFREDGSLKYNLVLAGRGKKNHKTSDVVIGGLFKLLIPEGWQGNDVLVVAKHRGSGRRRPGLGEEAGAGKPEPLRRAGNSSGGDKTAGWSWCGENPAVA